MRTPLVAIAIATYNHEKYIERCLNSILSQRTNFPFLLYVGEDCSTDCTRQICIKYEKEHPGKIKLLLTEKNNFRQNSSNIWNACFESGAKYIALCDGDDYWTDEFKLQKQIDYLNSHSDYVLTFHNVLVKNEILESEHLFSSYIPLDDKKDYSIHDTLRGWFMPTCSLVFRNVLKKFPEGFYNLKSGDMAVAILLAQHGKIKYFSDIMGCYRQNAGGFSRNHNGPKFIKQQLEFYDYFEALLDSKYHATIQKARLSLFRPVFDEYEKYSVEEIHENLLQLNAISSSKAQLLAFLFKWNKPFFKKVSWRVLN